MASKASPETVRSGERAAALALLFHDLPADDRRQRVASAMELIRTGELDPTGIFVLRTRGQLSGVVVCLPVPGAGGLIWPPHVVPGEDRRGREDALVQHACAWLRSRGAKLAQCLLAKEELPLANSLERNGFAHVTHLWYLEHNLQLAGQEACQPPRLEFLPYGPATAGAFHQTLLATYVDTLDCPELNGLRSVEEIIVGHQAQGTVPPDGWVLARSGGEPVGVCLLVVVPQSKSWELAYIGVVPAARRQGHGREIVWNALLSARAGGADRLTLSVDGRNTRAQKMYKGIGFTPIDRREVFLASWR